MPVVESPFVPSWYLKNKHLQTALPTLFRRLPAPEYRRERIATPDQDFLDLDWLKNGSSRLVILSHGLEGSSRAVYVKGMAHSLSRAGWDILAWNFRGCSGEPNKKLYWYHSGKYEDLKTVVEYAVATQDYSEIALLGFSVGGNITLKYLGLEGGKVPSIVSKAVALSVPLDLEGCADCMRRKENRVYMKRFLLMLHEKIRRKQQLFPGALDDSEFSQIKDFHEFDERYTAPLNGFSSAQEYWQSASSLPVLEEIDRPVLILSALDDTFLSDGSYPSAIAQKSSNILLEVSKWGGHVGFMRSFGEPHYYSEQRSAAFLNS